MTAPRNAAVLALCLLGLAATASAATCTNTGTVQLDLMSAATANTPLAKCLSSLQLTLADDSGNCKVTITPLAADGNVVDGMWGSGTLTYADYAPCPTTATSYTGTTQALALTTGISQHIYGTSVAAAAVTDVTLAAGKATFTQTVGGDLVFAITSTSGTMPAKATCAATGDATNWGVDLNECLLDVSASCPSGTYGVQIAANAKVCSVCPAGTTNDGSGDGCTPCAAATAKASVGAGSCSACAAGTYAQGGASDCLPCPAGTYGKTAGYCTDCPAGTYSWVPGSTACLFCAAGVPKCKSGNGFTLGGSACTDTDALSTASEGSAILSIATGGAALKAGFVANAALNAYAQPVLFDNCSATVTLSMVVSYDCSIEVLPMIDTTCAEPGADGYNYADLAIAAYYATPTAITTLLPSVDASVTSSYLLTLTANAAASTLDVEYLAASTDPTKAAMPTESVSATLTVNSGVNVVGKVEANAACPAGSYASGSSCYACPSGSACSSGTETACGADAYNPYVGASACLNCADCRTAGTCSDLTSDPGAEYCTVPWFDTSCADGTEYDDSSRSCVACPAGWKRLKGTDAACVPCATGTAQPLTGQSTCTACDSNKVAPNEGMAQCQTCPVGSTASSTTDCTPCGAGFYAAAPVGTASAVCTACTSGFYRSGDATPENNVCKPIPAGYREKTTGQGAAAAKSEIVPCEVGTVAYWDKDPTDPTAARYPAAAPTTCAACTGKAYAPRTGMQACLSCKAGTVPIQTDASYLGPNACASCATANSDDEKVGADHLSSLASYRDAFTDSNQCSYCPAGSETGPSNYAACTQCRPGFYMPGTATQAANDTCTACPRHYYQPQSGQTGCTACAAGSETFDDGNTGCSLCAKGWYNNKQGQACISAPAGSYVNTTGAITYTPCAVGFFSNQRGSDVCDRCAPGQYANTLGSKACKTCPAGTKSGGAASTCQSCSAGYFSASGSSVCSPCKAGYFAKTTKSATCSLCPKGFQCPLIATANPSPCKAGYFASKEGSKICSPCPINYYQDGTGATECKACAANTNTRGRTGQSKCQAVRSLRLAMF